MEYCVYCVIFVGGVYVLQYDQQFVLVFSIENVLECFYVCGEFGQLCQVICFIVCGIWFGGRIEFGNFEFVVVVEILGVNWVFVVGCYGIFLLFCCFDVCVGCCVVFVY